MKLSLILGSLLFGFATFALDLSSVSNQDLMNELSRRLSSGGTTGEASVSAFCGGGTLNIDLETQTKSTKHSQYIGSDCAKQITSMSSKLGTFSGIRILAFCAGGTLERLKLNSTGVLTQSSNYIGSDCQLNADQINKN